MFLNDTNAVWLRMIIILKVINVEDLSRPRQKSNGWAWMRDKEYGIYNNSTRV